MSLLVWLPLHGNLNNYGLSNATFKLVNSSGGLATTTAGKTAQAAYYRKTANTADYITSDINFTLSGDFSMCCWCKLTGYGTTDSANGIITQHGHTTGGSGITMHYVGASDYRMSINTGTSSSNRTYTTYYGSTNIYNDWHHLCVTYDRSASTYRMYVDGKAETIVGYGASVTYGDTAAARPFRLFDWSTDHSSNASYRPPCYLNDVRLYDHCLSAKEVKQISQGLIAHYKLNAHDCNNLLKGSYDFSGAGHSGNGTTFWDETSGLYLRKGDNSTATSGYKDFCSWSNAATVSANEVYTASFLARSTNSNKIIVYFYNNNSGVQVSNIKSSAGHDKSGTDGNCELTLTPEWKRYWITWTFNSTTTALAKTLLFRLMYGNAAEIAQVKLEKGGIATPYSLNSTENTMSFGDDSSSYNNNGTCSGALTHSTGSIRYPTCCVFDGASYIACGRGPMVRDALTVNWWGYMDDWTLYGSAPMRAISCTEGGGWNFEPSSSKMCFALGTGASSNTYKTVVDTTTFANYTAGWHMFTGTYDGYSSKIYIDGKLKNTNAAYTTKTPIYYHASNGIFIGAEAASSATTSGTPYFTGKISDVRIYATALSADDVAALYDAAGAVANDGTLLAYSFNEDSVDDAKINKNGIFIADTFNERGMLNNIKFTTLLSDNSAWGRIFYHNNQSGTVLFTTYDEVMKTDTTNKFSCLYLLDQLKATDGKYEFMLTYPSHSTTSMNRWKQTNNPCSEYMGTADSTLTATGYEAITINYNTNYWGGLTRQNSDATSISSCYLSGSVGHSNWFHAIGASSAWNGGVPGPNTAVQETELWIRLDTLPLNVKMSILNEKSVSAFRFLEI